MDDICTHCFEKVEGATCLDCGAPVGVIYPPMGADFFMEVCEMSEAPVG